jgi:hypothetical protein
MVKKLDTQGEFDFFARGLAAQQALEEAASRKRQARALQAAVFDHIEDCAICQVSTKKEELCSTGAELYGRALAWAIPSPGEVG